MQGKRNLSFKTIYSLHLSQLQGLTVNTRQQLQPLYLVTPGSNKLERG